jgi:hypothetical protein
MVWLTKADRIAKLEGRIKDFERIISELQDDTANLRKVGHGIHCYAIGTAIPENTILHLAMQHLKAIQKYLGVNVKWHWEDDRAAGLAVLPQIRVWEAVKIAGKKKSANK